MHCFAVTTTLAVSLFTRCTFSESVTAPQSTDTVLPRVIPFVPPPIPETFTFASGGNTTLRLGEGGWEGTVARGTIWWPSPNLAPFADSTEAATSTLPPSNFTVLAGIVTPAEADGLVSALDKVPFDQDADSVDGLPTHEFYIDKHGSVEAIGTIPGKRDGEPAVQAARLPVRTRLRELTRPLLKRLTPAVNTLYPEWCGEGGCRPCFSLVRRYNPGTRVKHPAHFDLQALVTVVVSLSSHGVDFEGGIYVSTGGPNETKFLGLQKGDAVAHQSDLLHGVHVLPRPPTAPPPSRWSWILWYKDGPENCSSEPAQWYRQTAEEAGNPVAQFLYAQRIHMAASAQGQADVAAERLRWLHKSAEGGFARAANEVGQCYKEGTGAAADLTLARRWFTAAAQTESDALYNLGLLEIEEGNVDQAIELFARAAKEGNRDAAHNLGVAHYRGFGSLERNTAVAREYFVHAANTEALRIVRQIDQEENRPSRSDL